MSQASNVIALPVAREKRYVPPVHRPTVIDIDEFFVKPPATALQEAKERIVREMPPRPNFEQMTEFERVVEVMNYQRIQLYVYQTVLFG